MSRYTVKNTVVLPSASAILAIFKLSSSENDILVIQNDVITLLSGFEVSAQTALTVNSPYCAAANTLLATIGDRLALITATNGGLCKRTTDFAQKIDVICKGSAEFFSGCGLEIHRHELDGRHRLLRTFREPVKALSATNANLLVMLSTSLRVIGMKTNEDLVEIPCEVANPIEIFWSVSLKEHCWFLAIIKPAAMDENRRHKIFMGEVNYKQISSEDILLDNVTFERSLKCTVKANKMLTLAENGNVILIHHIDNFGKLDLLYRGEATDSVFTSAEILRASTEISAPLIALGTLDGAIAFLDEA